MSLGVLCFVMGHSMLTTVGAYLGASMEGKHTALLWTESQVSSLGGYLCNNSSKEVTVYSPHEKKNKKNSRGNEGEKDTGGNEASARRKKTSG